MLKPHEELSANKIVGYHHKYDKNENITPWATISCGCLYKPWLIPCARYTANEPITNDCVVEHGESSSPAGRKEQDDT